MRLAAAIALERCHGSVGWSSSRAIAPVARSAPPSRAARRRLGCAAVADSSSSSSALASRDAASNGSSVSSASSSAWQTWAWHGHRIAYETAGPAGGTPILLVHGFGASSRHWRRNIPVLAAAGYCVFAVDLLGQGRSDKAAVDYSIELWAEQLRDFLAEVVQRPAVLVGNSVGSLASLTAAAEDAAGAVRGLVLLNCAGGMNNKAIADDWRIKLAMPIFQLIDWILLQPRLARYFFDRVRRRESLRSVLAGVYQNKESVDNELVDLIYAPSEDEGALEAFVSILTGPPGPRPEELVPRLRVPLLVLWGTSDTFTPGDGPVGRYFQALPQRRPRTQFHWLPTGHCPMDDDPEAVHQRLLPWLAELE